MRAAPRALPPPGIDWWVAPFAYVGVARELIARVKYRKARTSIRWMGEAITKVLPDHPIDVITWAPASTPRRRANGLDHGELLARAVGHATGIPVRRLLARDAGAPQTGAPRRDRAAGPGLRPAARSDGLRVLVVDDVTTTGATLATAARVLRSAGASGVAAATAARTPRPGDA